MTVVPSTTQSAGGGGSSGLYDVLELVLDRGLVIDVFVRVSLIGIELVKIDVRVVVASVDTYLRFAQEANRLDLEAGPHKPAGLPEMLEGAEEGSAQNKTKGALTGAAEKLSDAFTQGREQSSEQPSEQERQRGGRRGTQRRKEVEE